METTASIYKISFVFTQLMIGPKVTVQSTKELKKIYVYTKLKQTLKWNHLELLAQSSELVSIQMLNEQKNKKKNPNPTTRYNRC